MEEEQQKSSPENEVSESERKRKIDRVARYTRIIMTCMECIDAGEKEEMETKLRKFIKLLYDEIQAELPLIRKEKIFTYDDLFSEE